MTTINKEEIQKFSALADEWWDVEGKFKLPPENLAGGGIAGMLGEPTYEEDNHRVPLKYGKRPDIWQQLLDEDWDYMESNEWENILGED